MKEGLEEVRKGIGGGGVRGSEGRGWRGRGEGR